MSAQATGKFTGTSWNETTYQEVEGEPKLARVSATNRYEGDVEGESSLEYLLVYREDGKCSFVGYERVAGRLGGRSGSFVLEQQGLFADGVAQATWTVVPGTATGELRGLRGEGGFTADTQGNSSLTLSYDFD